MGKKRKEEKRKEESWIIIRRIGNRERIEGLKRVLAVLLLTVFRFLEIICISLWCYREPKGHLVFLFAWALCLLLG